MAKILRMSWSLILYIIYNFVVTASVRNDTRLILMFLNKLSVIFPKCISQRIRIIVPIQDHPYHDDFKNENLRTVHTIYKSLSVEAYVALSSIYDTEKVNDDAELRIFPFVSNFSKFCNLYLNHDHDIYHYYLFYVDMPKNVKTSLENCRIAFDSNMYIFYANNNSMIYMEEVYKVKSESRDIKRTLLAEYNALNNQLRFLTSMNKWNRRTDLNGLKFNAYMIPNNPYVIYEDVPADKIEHPAGDIKGMFVDIADILSRNLNFTVNKIKSPISSYDLTIESVGKRMVDMSIGPYSITSQRAKLVDFSLPIFQEKLKLFFPLKEHKIRWNAFFKPFYLKTWIAITIYVIGSGVFITVIFFVVRDSVFHNNSVQSLSFVILSTIGKRFPVEPHSMSGKMAFLTVSLVGFILISLYRAMLGASLAIYKIHVPVHSMEEVLDSEYWVATMAGTLMEDYFKNQTDETLTLIKDNKLTTIPTHSITSVEEALNTIIENYTNTLAFFGKSTSHSMPGLVCRLSSVDEEYMAHGIGLAFQKNWPYTKLINNNILSLLENGTINKLISSWQRKQTHCEIPEYERSDLFETFTLYVMLFFGWGLSAFAFFLELLY